MAGLRTGSMGSGSTRVRSFRTGRRGRGWFLCSGLVLALAAAFVLVIPALAGGRAVDDAGEAPRPGRAIQPPIWDQVLQIRDELRAAVESPDYPIDATQLAAVATAPGPYTPLGRIALPGTGLDVRFGAGVHPPVLERGPGHWPGTALPGQAGNSVLSGHRTTYTHPFTDLDLLESGDVIAITPEGAAIPVVYRVTQTSIVPEAEYAEFVLRQPADPAVRELTLFACHPKGQRTHRIVVRAAAEPLAEGVSEDAPGPR